MSGPAVPAVATSLFATSAFRVLGLDASAPPERIVERLKLLEAAPEPHRPELDLAWLPDVVPDADTLARAAAALNRTESRLRERMLWFHRKSDVDALALTAVREGRVEEAEDLWLQAWRDSPGMAPTAAHNLAILSHSRALSAPRGEAGAKKDLENARRWWRHMIDGGRLTVPLLDGEADDLASLAVVPHALAAVTAEIQESLSLSSGRAGAARVQAGYLPLVDGEWVLGDDLGMGITNAPARQGLVLQALEEAEEAARRGDRDTFEAMIDKARDLCRAPAEGRRVEEVYGRLSRRLVMRGLRPVRTPPVVVSSSGLGTTLVGLENVDQATHSYEARLMFTLAHLPVVPLGRFRVSEREDGSYDFLGQLPPDGWMLIHGLVTAGFLFVFLWGAAHLSNLPSRSLERFVGAGPWGNRPEIARLGGEEMEELKVNAVARMEKIRELDETLRKLREEIATLQTVTIPGIEGEMKELEAFGDPAGKEMRKKGLEIDLSNAKLRLKAIPKDIEAVQELRQAISSVGAQDL